MQALTALLTGSIVLDSHLTKATTWLAINASPEPVINFIASVTEDATVIGTLYLIINHPAAIAVELEHALIENIHQAYILDGDNIRHGLNKNPWIFA